MESTAKSAENRSIHRRNRTVTNLFKPECQNSRLDSTVAYAVTYYPWSKLSVHTTKLIAWQKTVVFVKSELILEMDDDLLNIFFPGDRTKFVVKWEYNNVPTKEQWDALDQDQFIRVQFRISSLAGDTGRIALLSLIGFGSKQLAKERLK